MRSIRGPSRALGLALLASAGQSLDRRVFFIGNSFTYRYGEPEDRQGLPAAVAALAASRGDSLDWDWHVRGGATLRWHVENGVLDALRSAPERYDAVVLQAYSQELATPRATARASVWPYAAAIVNATAAAGHGALWLFLTWEYPGGLGHPGADIDAFQERLNAGTYELAAALGGAPVAPAGLAWRAARERGGDALHARLFDTDDKHPNTLGTYLNALVFDAALFDYPARASMRARPSPGALGLFGATGTPDEDADAAVLRESALAPQGALLLATRANCSAGDAPNDDERPTRPRTRRSTRASPARSSWACSSLGSPWVRAARPCATSRHGARAALKWETPR